MRKIDLLKEKKVVENILIKKLQFIESLEDRIDLKNARKALKDIKKQGTVSWKKIKSQLKI